MNTSTLSAMFSGRLGRAHFALTALAMFVLAAVLGILMSVLMSVSDSLGQLFALVEFIIYIAMAVVGLGVSVRRYHDLGWSGWLVLLGFIPLVNLVMFLILLFKAGTPGANAYGVPVSKDVPLMDAVMGRVPQAAMPAQPVASDPVVPASDTTTPPTV